MRITVKLFAMLIDKLPPGSKNYSTEVEVEEGATAQTIVDMFEISPQMAHVIMLDGYHLLPQERENRRLKEGEVVAIIPPVAGG